MFADALEFAFECTVVVIQTLRANGLVSIYSRKFELHQRAEAFHLLHVDATMGCVGAAE